MWNFSLFIFRQYGEIASCTSRVNKDFDCNTSSLLIYKHERNYSVVLVFIKTFNNLSNDEDSVGYQEHIYI